MRNKSLVTSFLTLLALGGGLAVVDTELAFAAPDCSGEAFISCNVAKNKHLQICIEPENGDAAPKFTYQFTEKGKDGLSLSEAFSAKTVAPWKGVGRAINSTVTFNNEGYKYQVWQSFDRLDEEAELEAGVHISKGDEDIASFTCQRDGQTKIAPLFALEDAMEQAGWCYDSGKFEWLRCENKSQ